MNVFEEFYEIVRHFQSAPPWTFKKTGLTLHRFLKIEKSDEMVIDIISAGEPDEESIIDNAIRAKSDSGAIIKVAAKADLIRLKKRRNSKQDQADIERLLDEEPG